MEAPIRDTTHESDSLEKFDPEKGSVRENQAVRELFRRMKATFPLTRLRLLRLSTLWKIPTSILGRSCSRMNRLILKCDLQWQILMTPRCPGMRSSFSCRLMPPNEDVISATLRAWFVGIIWAILIPVRRHARCRCHPTQQSSVTGCKSVLLLPISCGDH